MRTSEQIGALTKALVAAQSKMDNAPMNKTNPHFKSKYSDLPAVREATIKALTDHGLAILQGTDVADDGRLTLRTRLMHESGEWIESSYPLPTDLNKPQAMGSALTYARRYTWASICGIAADEDDDAHGAQDAGQQRAKAQQQPRQQRQVETPFDAPDEETEKRMAEGLRSQITVTRTEADLDQVISKSDWLATFKSLPDHLKAEIKGVGAEHRQYIRSLTRNAA